LPFVPVFIRARETGDDETNLFSLLARRHGAEAADTVFPDWTGSDDRD
jgi:hypothetical protein